MRLYGFFKGGIVPFASLWILMDLYGFLQILFHLYVFEWVVVVPYISLHDFKDSNGFI